MYRFIFLFCVQAILFKEALTYSVGCNGFQNIPTVATGNAYTTVGGCGGCPVQSNVPLVTEIHPNLQFGDISLGGDIPIGGSIKVCGCFPVYGSVAVDGAVPSCGSALINAGGGLVANMY